MKQIVNCQVQLLADNNKILKFTFFLHKAIFDQPSLMIILS